MKHGMIMIGANPAHYARSWAMRYDSRSGYIADENGKSVEWEILPSPIKNKSGIKYFHI